MESFTPRPEWTDQSLTELRGAISAVETPEDVDMIATTLLEEDSYAQSIMDKITAARRHGNKEAEQRFVKERADIFRGYQLKVALETGVEIEAVEHEKQNQEYKSKIADIISNVDSSSSHEEIMLELGILEPVEGPANYRFRFPSKIFPPYVQEQWETYTDIVDQFERATAKLKAGMITQNDFSGVDLARTNAHNSVSSSVASILEFPGWDLEEYRGFVAKLRDHKYATSMGEVNRYAAALKGRFGETDVQLQFDEESLVDINRAIIEYKKD